MDARRKQSTGQQDATERAHGEIFRTHHRNTAHLPRSRRVTNERDRPRVLHQQERPSDDCDDEDGDTGGAEKEVAEEYDVYHHQQSQAREHDEAHGEAPPDLTRVAAVAKGVGAPVSGEERKSEGFRPFVRRLGGPAGDRL